jgi:hypothetical protein
MINLGKTIDVKVKYPTKFIVDTLNKSRIAHVAEYKVAVEEYNAKVKEALYKVSLQAIEASKRITEKKEVNTEELNNQYTKLRAIKAPINAEKMYDQYITLFQATTDEYIELDLQDANALINDEWDWVQEAKFINSTYAASSSRR